MAQRCPPYHYKLRGQKLRHAKSFLKQRYTECETESVSFSFVVRDFARNAPCCCQCFNLCTVTKLLRKSFRNIVPGCLNGERVLLGLGLTDNSVLDQDDCDLPSIESLAAPLFPSMIVLNKRIPLAITLPSISYIETVPKFERSPIVKEECPYTPDCGDSSSDDFTPVFSPIERLSVCEIERELLECMDYGTVQL